MMEDELISFATPCGFNSSTCGYCGTEPGKRSESESSRSYGLLAHQLSARVYGLMCDSGWRRSGTYCYRMDNGTTCCPHVTIRCLAKDFRASKSQRQLLNRFVHRVRATGLLTSRKDRGSRASDPPTEMTQGSSKDHPPIVDLPAQTPHDAVSLDGTRLVRTPASHEKAKGKGKGNVPFSVLEAFAEVELEDSRFSIRTEPSSFSDEKFKLFQLYQRHIHNDDDASERGFKRFLCDTPITQRAAPGIAYGSFHQLYRLDNVLVAIGVIDILPTCVSSVYFVWHPHYSDLSLGKVGALREIALVQRLSQVLPDLRYYYLGFYIHSCPKMRYKADYRPTELADMLIQRQVDYTFHPFESCQPLLDRHKRALFSSHSIEVFGKHLTSANIAVDSRDGDDNEDTSFPPTGWLDPEDLPPALIASAKVWSNRTVRPLLRSAIVQDDMLMQNALEGLAALGQLSSEIVLAML